MLTDEMKDRVLTDNTAQDVLKQLTAQESNRKSMRTRWIWELLQNARDTSAASVSIERGPGEIVFRHNGAKFKEEEIAHLIYHGSTKVEDERTIGQYGSGFLTTHLLSPEINVSGQLDSGQFFKFCLKRAISSVQDLSESMNRARDNFNNSLSKASPPNGFTTQFRYPISGEDGANAVRDGLETLKQCAPLVVAFNAVFSHIGIKSLDETMSFKVTNRESLSKDGLQKITVSEDENGSQKGGEFLLVEGPKTSIAVPLEPLADSGRALLGINNTPRLFLGFPLIGAENFSFPAVINSFVFTPTEDRDGVYLWQGDNEANHKNQAAMEEACELLIGLLQFVAKHGWSKTYTLAIIPDIHEQTWLDPDGLRRLLKNLIERIRQTPAVLCEHGTDPITPQDSILPFAEEEAGVEALWDLLAGLKEFRHKLPRRNEAAGWCKAIKSWRAICPETTFDEAFNGHKLAESVGEQCDTLENLQELLREEVDAVQWLDQLYRFLKENGLFDNETRGLRIFPDQADYLNELSNLYCDQDIDEELKDIAELLDWNIREELRHKQLDSLTDEKGAGERKRDYVVHQLITKLQERADKKPDASFAEAGVCLFRWIISQKNWDRLRGFPVFAKQDDSGDRTPFRLERNEEDKDDERPLAPVGAWPEDLQPFSGLFPQDYILADDFFETMSDLDTWQTLETQGFIRTNVIITKDGNFDKFLPDEPLSDDKEHESVASVTTTDIVFLQKERVGIMERVRNSQSRARLFWRFLTEWLVKKDMSGVEKKKTDCKCGDTHHYFPAAWLVPLAKNIWVPLGDNKRDRATAKSLASLLRGSEWKPGSLTENPAAVKLLEAIGVTRLDLLRAFGAPSDEERRAQDNVLAEILVATDGNIEHLSELVGDLQDDAEGLFNHLEERREQKRMVRKNQHLGKCVEELVKEILKDEGFTVTRTGIGSDYEIELSKEEQKWLVEVKSTQGQEVRMTDTQARTAVEEEDGFLLCVVPVESEKPTLDEVRDTMRFVENMGSRVEQLCQDLNEFEELRSEITEPNDENVQLVVEAGTVRVRVTSSVWQDNGFPLAELSNRLQ